MSRLSRIHDQARRDRGISRRTFLGWSAALAALPILNNRAEGAVARAFSFKANPFSVGIASGDPTDSGVVLWTRLAPEPFAPGGGMPENLAVEVSWEVATDEAMKDVVRKGTCVATPQLAHSVHAEVEGLQPDRWYWYRFRSGDAESAVGRARTMPLADASPDALRFAFASCQHFEAGYFTAYDRMSKDDLDLVFHLGDYIYEREGMEGKVRKHLGAEIESLDDYRIRHALYKSDPHLQAAHAHCPWFVTWDDHEVENNYANDVAEGKGVDPAQFLLRRANAYQAYYEMMPLRKGSVPRGPHMQLYRKASFGRLAEFMVLDTRQYRTDQPNGDRSSPINDDAMNPKATLLGSEQGGWLQQKLIESPATWNVLAQQVMMGMVGRRRETESEGTYSMDQWPGYAHERLAVVDFLRSRRVLNPVVLTGDIHTNWVNDLRVDDRKPEQPIVATEFVGTSITSGGDGTASTAAFERVSGYNPCVRYHNNQRGYVRCLVTPQSWKSDYVVVDKVTERDAPTRTAASFVVEAGKPGAQPA